MATPEGIFPKSGNDPVYYSEINNLFGKSILFNNIAQTIYNADYIGANGNNQGYMGGFSGLNFYNLDFDTFKLNETQRHPIGIIGSNCGSYNNVALYGPHACLVAGSVYDWMSGNVIASNKWSYSGTSTAGSTVVLTSFSNAYFAQSNPQGSYQFGVWASGINLRGVNDKSECIFRVRMRAEGRSNGAGYEQIWIYDNNDVSGCVYADTVNNSDIDKSFRCVFTSGTCTTTEISQSTPSAVSTISTSGLTGSIWRMFFYSRADFNNGGGATSSTGNIIQVWPIYYVRGESLSGTAYDFITSGITTSGNALNAYLTYNGCSGLNSAITSDNSTYYPVNNNSFIGLPSSGTTLKTKINFGGTWNIIPTISEYATFYNL